MLMIIIVNTLKQKEKTFLRKSIITSFHNKKVPKEKMPHKCLSIIVLDSVIKTDNNKYYPQTFLEECVYKQQKQKQKKQKDYITEELKSNSDSSNESDSDSNNESEPESDSDSNDDETKSDIDNDE